MAVSAGNESECGRQSSVYADKGAVMVKVCRNLSVADSRRL